MITDAFNYGDRPGFIERLGALSGKTTYREPGGAGHQPYVTASISPDNAMVLALSLARRNPRDIGPEIAYSVGTGQPHQRQKVIFWLADKLYKGTGHHGRNAERQLVSISSQAYDLVIGARRKIIAPKQGVKEFEVLANIGAGWLWMAMESAVERAEYAMHGNAKSDAREPVA